jgi:hypothetical protein
MERRNIFPYNIKDTPGIECEDDGGQFWEVNKWDRVRDEHIGPDFEQVNIGGSCPAIMMLTGTIIRLPSYSFIDPNLAKRI